MILLGNILSRRFLPQSFFDNCDKLVFRIALPIFLFCKLVESDLSHLPDPNAIIFCVIAIVCAFTIISVGALLFIPTDKRGAFVHGTFRANFSIIGFVLAIAAEIAYTVLSKAKFPNMTEAEKETIVCGNYNLEAPKAEEKAEAEAEAEPAAEEPAEETPTVE